MLGKQKRGPKEKRDTWLKFVVLADASASYAPTPKECKKLKQAGLGKYTKICLFYISFLVPAGWTTTGMPGGFLVYALSLSINLFVFQYVHHVFSVFQIFMIFI